MPSGWIEIYRDFIVCWFQTWNHTLLVSSLKPADYFPLWFRFWNQSHILVCGSLRETKLVLFTPTVSLRLPGHTDVSLTSLTSLVAISLREINPILPLISIVWAYIIYLKLIHETGFNTQFFHQMGFLWNLISHPNHGVLPLILCHGPLWTSYLNYSWNSLDVLVYLLSLIGSLPNSIRVLVPSFASGPPHGDLLSSRVPPQIDWWLESNIRFQPFTLELHSCNLPALYYSHGFLIETNPQFLLVSRGGSFGS